MVGRAELGVRFWSHEKIMRLLMWYVQWSKTYKNRQNKKSWQKELEETIRKTDEESEETGPPKQSRRQVGKEITSGKLYRKSRKNPQYLGMKKSLMILSHFTRIANKYKPSYSMLRSKGSWVVRD